LRGGESLCESVGSRRRRKTGNKRRVAERGWGKEHKKRIPLKLSEVEKTGQGTGGGGAEIKKILNTLGPG